MSGSAGERVAVVTANARSLPALMGSTMLVVGSLPFLREVPPAEESRRCCSYTQQQDFRGEGHADIADLELSMIGLPRGRREARHWIRPFCLASGGGASHPHSVAGNVLRFSAFRARREEVRPKRSICANEPQA
jgi:hypothetical protein